MVGSTTRNDSASRSVPSTEDLRASAQTGGMLDDFGTDDDNYREALGVAGRLQGEAASHRVGALKMNRISSCAVRWWPGCCPSRVEAVSGASTLPSNGLSSPGECAPEPPRCTGCWAPTRPTEPAHGWPSTRSRETWESNPLYHG